MEAILIIVFLLALIAFSRAVYSSGNTNRRKRFKCKREGTLRASDPINNHLSSGEVEKLRDDLKRSYADFKLYASVEEFEDDWYVNYDFNTGNRNYQEYLRSDAWKKVRVAARLKHGNVCCVCGDPKVEVHHKNYDHVFNEQFNNYEDLELRCRSCHQQWHDEDDIKKGRLFKGV